MVKAIKVVNESHAISNTQVGTIKNGDPCGVADFVLFHSGMLGASSCACPRSTDPLRELNSHREFTKFKIRP
jgi:hypothetical protein